MASRHGIVSAEAADDLKQVQAALADAPDELKRLIGDTARSQLTGAWRQELTKRPASRAQKRFVTSGAVASPFASGLTVRTGDPKLVKAYEFGTNDREKKSTYRSTSRRGRSYQVTRRTRRQLPTRRAGGWIAYPAANSLGTRVFAMWAQITLLATARAARGE